MSSKPDRYFDLVNNMKNKSKIKFGDLSDKANKPELKPLSDAETIKVVGGLCPWCPPGIPGIAR